MGTFTMPLKKVIKITGGTDNIVNGVTKLVGGNIGLGYYTIFDEDYRDTLNGLIVDRYYNREIGMESIEMFQLAMRRRMNEIMPYYNKLFLTEKIEHDPLSTVNLRTMSNGNAIQVAESAGESDSTGYAGAKSRSVSSETPQTMLSGSGDYATAANDANSTSDNTSAATQSSTDNANTTSTNENHTTGYQGLASDLVMRYRDSLLNIGLMVIGELEDCFMLVWDNGDSYTNSTTRESYAL